MKKFRWIFLCFFLLSAPSALASQGIAIGGRAGFLGFGGELAVGLSDVIALRGGFGFFPFEYDGSFDGEDYTVTFPSSIWTAGIDVYPGGGPIRIMGGIMARTEDIKVKSEITGSQEIGNTIYDVPGTISGVVKQDAIAPFAGIGFGKHTEGGFGFFLDIGAALSGDANIVMSATGPVASVPGIQASLQEEAEKVEDDAGGYLKVWPIVSLGIKIPISAGY